MAIYAVAQVVHKSCRWFTAGREYLVLHEYTTDRPAFDVKTDNGKVAYCLWECCAHINYNNWTRIERKD